MDEAPPPLVGAGHIRLLLGALALAATVALGGWLFVRYTGGVGRFLAIAARISPTDWLVILAATAVFYGLDYVRFASLLSILGHRLTWRLGLRLTSVSYFVSNLTPLAELHLPAMVFLLTRAGIPVAHATAATMVKSVYMVVWICIIAGVALATHPSAHLPPVVVTWLPLSLSIIALLVGLLLAPILFAGPLRRWSGQLDTDGGWLWRLLRGAAKVADTVAVLGRSASPKHILCHAASIAFVLAYVFVGYWLCRSIGVPMTLTRALPVFSGSLLIAYIAPIPGAIGVTEAATSYLIDPTMPPDAMAVTVLLRLLCWYIVGAPGAAMFLASVRRRPRN